MRCSDPFSTPARMLALGGMMSILSVFCLYMVAIIPTARLFFFFLASMIPAVVVLKTNTTTAMISYGAVVCLSLVLLPRRIFLIPYIAFFGYYAILKLHLEKLSLWMELVLKILLFNIAIYICSILYKLFFQVTLAAFNMPQIVLMAVGTLGLLAYDYLFSYFITVIKYFIAGSFRE